MKPKLQKQFQNVRDAQNVDHFSRKAAATKWSWPKKESVCAVRLTKPVEAHMIPKAPDAGYEATGLVFALLGFSLALV